MSQRPIKRKNMNVSGFDSELYDTRIQYKNLNIHIQIQRFRNIVLFHKLPCVKEARLLPVSSPVLVHNLISVNIYIKPKQAMRTHPKVHKGIVEVD